jgi:hypothetical protein
MPSWPRDVCPANVSVQLYRYRTMQTFLLAYIVIGTAQQFVMLEDCSRHNWVRWHAYTLAGELTFLASR